jgi:hypothetical protein
MSFARAARVIAVAAAFAAAAGSATSGSNTSQSTEVGANAASSAPPPQQMDPTRALGLWRSTFGAVKIEADLTHGGLPQGGIHGVWLYQRQGQEVIGYFTGTLRGNVLQFHWQEPNTPPLVGEGYLVFDPQGRQYSGRWWSDKRDRVGDWNGWRPPTQTAAQNPGDPGQYGGDPGQDGDPAAPAPARRPPPYQGRPQPYPPQGQPYAPQGQPYAPQGQPYAPQGQQEPPYAQPAPPQPAQPQPTTYF